jgi:hypothetical protein
VLYFSLKPVFQIFFVLINTQWFMRKFGFSCRSKHRVTLFLMLGLSSRESQSEQNNTEHSTVFPYNFNARHIGRWRCRQMPVGSTLLWVQAMFLETLVTKTCQCSNETRLISVLSSKDCLCIFTQDVHCQFIHIYHTTHILRTKRI